MTEADLYEQLAQYMNLKYPGVPYHFDLSGVNNPSPRTRALYARLNKRAWPDLFLAVPHYEGSPELGSHGLFLELKKVGTRLQKRDGGWASPHIAEQAAVLDQLGDQGYIAQFACGYEDAVTVIESYLKGAV